MTNRAIQRISTLFICAIALSSCAYMQTHKNIEESARVMPGYHLASHVSLYKAGGNYYLELDTQKLRKHYPTIYDSILLKQNNAPWFTKAGQGDTKVYCPISEGTATVLQRKDGYSELSVLKAEVETSRKQWTDSLPEGARRCNISAELTGNAETWADEAAAPAVPVGMKVAGTLEQVVVDWPGTVLYNAAIPFMAPFVFFHQFLTEE